MYIDIRNPNPAIIIHNNLLFLRLGSRLSLQGLFLLDILKKKGLNWNPRVYWCFLPLGSVGWPSWFPGHWSWRWRSCVCPPAPSWQSLCHSPGKYQMVTPTFPRVMKTELLGWTLRLKVRNCCFDHLRKSFIKLEENIFILKISWESCSVLSNSWTILWDCSVSLGVTEASDGVSESVQCTLALSDNIDTTCREGREGYCWDKEIR